MRLPERKSGLAFHARHDRLVSWVPDYGQQVEELRQEPQEQELRLRLFRLIPKQKLPAQLVEAEEACQRAQAAYTRTREARGIALHALYEALELTDFAQLHAELCPNCPWDGHTIFPEDCIASPQGNK